MLVFLKNISSESMLAKRKTIEKEDFRDTGFKGRKIGLHFSAELFVVVKNNYTRLGSGASLRVHFSFV